MDILAGGIGLGIFVFIITILVPILYFTAEIIGCSVIALFMKIFNRTMGFKNITKYFTFSLIFRMAVILVVCIILSSISHWNYNRIMSNPSHNQSIYVDKMSAIFANRNNEGNGLYSILHSINLIGLPLLYVLNIIYTMIINRHRYAKPISIPGYILFVLNGIVLAFICYLFVIQMMGV